MTNKKVAFLPFNALNEFMRPDYRLIVVQTVFQALPKLPEPHPSSINRMVKKMVQVPGFRNSALAPSSLKVRPTIHAFEKNPEVVAVVLSAWAETKPDLRQKVFDLLSARKWELLPTEADRTKLPGFLTQWPKGEDFEGINQAYTAAYPDDTDTTDDISLMVVWLSGRLPVDPDDETENEVEQPE